MRVQERQLQVAPAVEAQLNDRQRRILSFALESGSVTTGWCTQTLGVARDTAHRDLTALVKLGLLTRLGSGRNTRYVRKQEETIA